MKPHVLVAIGLLSAGCSLGPPAAEPAPPPAAPDPILPGPRLPQDNEPLYAEQKLDFTIIAGPESMAPGKTEPLTARVMAPPGSQVVGVQATQGKDAFSYALKLTMRVPVGAGDPRPLEVQIPFSPAAGGTYFLDSARRYSVQVTGTPTYPASGGYTTSSGTGTTPSFLDAQAYTGGAYTPGGGTTGGGTTGGGVTTPASADSSSKPLFGSVVVLETLTAGAIQGNAQVSERHLLELKGPTYGRRGERLTYTATLWTAGTGPMRADVIQNGFEVQVSALMAPAEREPIGAPMPRQAALQFNWVFQDPGTYRITSNNGVTLTTVQIY